MLKGQILHLPAVTTNLPPTIDICAPNWCRIAVWRHTSSHKRRRELICWPAFKHGDSMPLHHCSALCSRRCLPGLTSIHLMTMKRSAWQMCFVIALCGTLSRFAQCIGKASEGEAQDHPTTLQLLCKMTSQERSLVSQKKARYTRSYHCTWACRSNEAKSAG